MVYVHLVDLPIEPDGEILRPPAFDGNIQRELFLLVEKAMSHLSSVNVDLEAPREGVTGDF